MSDRGSASLVVLAALLVLSLLFVGLLALVELSQLELRRSVDTDRERDELRELAREAVDQVLEDPTPSGDSPLDPIWELLDRLPPDGYTIILRDRSSRLGVNWVRKEVVGELGVMAAGKSVGELQQFREDTGLHLSMDTAYGDFFQDEELERLFSPYGYFNINITDEFVLRLVYGLRTGSPERAAAFHSKVQQARVRDPEELPDFIERDELAAFLGADYDALFPVINAEPAINIHFAPRRVVEALLRHYSIAESGADMLLAEREQRELTEARLAELLGKEAATTPILHYLGVRTWFWELVVSGPTQELTWIMGRIPRDEMAFHIVEEHWR